MPDVPVDVDDAGIFGLVLLATIVVGAGLVQLGLSLWLVLPAFLVLAFVGEFGARKLAAVKRRQEVE